MFENRLSSIFIATVMSFVITWQH